jgi:LytTr DNA-binding domain
MLKILRQPFPCFNGGLRTLRFTGYAAFCVFLVLFLMAPFGLRKLTTPALLLHTLLFGLVTFILASFNSVVIPRLLPRLYKEERWTVGKEMLSMIWNVLLIAMGNLLLSQWLYADRFSWQLMGRILWITAAVGIFPITLTTLLKQYRLQKRYVDAAARLEETLHEPTTPVEASRPLLVFLSENGKDQFAVAPNTLLYIQSADNYIKFYYTTGKAPTIFMLRSTLKKAADNLQNEPHFYRCHRTCIVNLQKVQHISGNAQGYKLHLPGVESPVPVSRNLNDEIALRLQLAHR